MNEKVIIPAEPGFRVRVIEVWFDDGRIPHNTPFGASAEVSVYPVIGWVIDPDAAESAFSEEIGEGPWPQPITPVGLVKSSRHGATSGVMFVDPLPPGEESGDPEQAGRRAVERVCHQSVPGLGVVEWDGGFVDGRCMITFRVKKAA